MSTCDIIIPTHNGREKLEKTLLALLEQHIPPGWSVRVIISDDGSDDPLDDVGTRYAWGGPWVKPLYLKGAHQGRSHARNRAIDRSNANILLLLADDILLRPNALNEHLLFHGRNPEVTKAALGCVIWDPRIRPTAFMDWMMHGGQQNDYDALLGVSTCGASHYFYGSLISLKREFLGKERFSDAFTVYGWEDLELGARLEKKGLTIQVLHNARATHFHKYLAREILKRQRLVGSAQYRVNTNSIRRLSHGLYGLLGVRRVVTYTLNKWGDKLNMPRLFALATAGEFWYGVHHANRVLKSEKI